MRAGGEFLVRFSTEIILGRALPMVSSLIGPQYHDDQFWTFSESAAEHDTNDFDVKIVPTFSEDFEVKIRYL